LHQNDLLVYTIAKYELQCNINVREKLKQITIEQKMRMSKYKSQQRNMKIHNRLLKEYWRNKFQEGVKQKIYHAENYRWDLMDARGKIVWDDWMQAF
jgi:hypothetical protein